MLKLLFSFQGRIGRKSYWVGSSISVLFIFIPMLVVMVMGASQIYALATNPEANPDTMKIALKMIFASLALLPFLALYLWTALAVTAKRFHDLDMPGFYSLLIVAAGLLTFLLPFLAGLISIAWWVGFIAIGCIKGTNGANKYGADPLLPD